MTSASAAESRRTAERIASAAAARRAHERVSPISRFKYQHFYGVADG